MPWRATSASSAVSARKVTKVPCCEILLDLGQRVGGRSVDDPAGDPVAEPLVDQRAKDSA